MKITNLQGISFINAVNESMKGKHLPVRIAFAIKQNYSLIMETQIKPYEETRVELIKKYEKEDGNTKLVEELNSLLQEESDLAIKCVDIAELEKLDIDPSYDKLSLSDIDAIGFMISE